MDLNKQLYRSDTNKILFGVCGGLGEYFNIDPTIIRLLWVVFACSTIGKFDFRRTLDKKRPHKGGHGKQTID